MVHNTHLSKSQLKGLMANEYGLSLFAKHSEGSDQRTAEVRSTRAVQDRRCSPTSLDCCMLYVCILTSDLCSQINGRRRGRGPFFNQWEERGAWEQLLETVGGAEEQLFESEGRAGEQLFESLVGAGEQLFESLVRAREQLFESVGGAGEQLLETVGGRGAWEQLSGEEGQLLELIGVGGAWASSVVVQVSLSDTICHTSAGLPDGSRNSARICPGTEG